jgi:5-methylcytosine-specific restriction endonuclease McrA
MAPRLQRSEEAKVWQRWYKTARWQALRRQILSAHPLCSMCHADGRLTPATVCDHVVPHKGDPALFWNSGNLTGLCKPHHDAAKQAEERRGFSLAVDADGYPVDPAHPANRGG